MSFLRAIKFRAWDKVNNRMGYFEKGFSWCDEYDLWYLLSIGDSITDVSCGDNIILMQFTGLKDKSGKEIFEGDIVENYAFRDVVIFDKGIFTTKRSTPDKFKVKQPLLVHKELEVIGNKFENPELLRVRE